MTKSSQFILPILDLTFSELQSNGYLDTYIGIESKDFNYAYGEVVIIAFFPDRLTLKLSEALKKKESFIETFTLDNKLFYVFSIPDEDKLGVFYFSKGQYSKIPEDFKKRHYNYLSAMFMHKICLKHKDLYEEWERKGVHLGEEQEVWSAPIREEEIYHSQL